MPAGLRAAVYSFLLSLLALVATGCSSAPDAPASSALPERTDGAIRLTAPLGGSSDQNPAFSPDGARLVFTRFENGYNDGPAGLFLLDLADGAVTRLTPVEDQDNVNLPGAAWNAVANRIVFASDRLETYDLWRVAPDGSDFGRITTHSGLPYFIEPSWSPDGQWIVFEARRPEQSEDGYAGQIWKVRADGSGLTQLTDGYDDRQPNWSPAGDRILFQRRAPNSDDWNIYTVAPDGSDIQPVTDDPSSDTDAAWSPHGERIVYSSDYGGLAAPNLFIISAQGGAPIRVTFDNERQDSAPSWSPDGKWIAFESRQGPDETASASLWWIPVPLLSLP